MNKYNSRWNGAEKEFAKFVGRPFVYMGLAFVAPILMAMKFGIIGYVLSFTPAVFYCSHMISESKETWTRYFPKQK